MVRKEKLVAAESAGVPIHLDESIRSITFTDSPYYAHMHLSAIDIYPKNKDSLVPSPVTGRVIRIRPVKAPLPAYFKADEDEKLLLISNSMKLTTKILHLKPCVDVGEMVEVSSPLGKYVRSGFFNFWTDYHIHVEVRPNDDPIRAQGSFPVAPKLLGNHDEKGKEQIDPDQIPCEVVSVAPEYLLLRPPRPLFGSLGGYFGLRVLISEDIEGILDGGFPHYGIGGVLLSNAANVKAGDIVRIGDLSIGEVCGGVTSHDGPVRYYVRVRFKERIKVRLAGRLHRGLALALSLLSSHQLLLKVVPCHPYNKEELQAFRDHEDLSVTDVL
jgi:hypothetical protein